MKQKIGKLLTAVKGYPTLSIHNQRLLRAWAGSVGNLLLMVFKFLAGLLLESGYLCVSALYSGLMGVAKRNYITANSTSKTDTRPPEMQFQRIGLFILLAGMVYGVYMGRLIAYPQNTRSNYTLPVGILIALVSFVDLGVALFALVKRRHPGEQPLLSLGKKLVGLSSAMPPMVMTQIVLNSIADERNMSFFDGVLGSLVGFVIFGIGLGMVIYSRRYVSREKPLHDDMT